ncbi:MAG: quinone oxidoreductase [Betaproteobacteria bacterium RIFCSPLOWO2_02_FULL_67_26]|nr:MAG: quinone oxidoreductase [Betaproteobacteria bacterium RIFCSPLOWO2_02_FULL_67_26]
MNPFQALRVFDENGKATARVVEVALAELSPGEVVLQAAYSSVNYKDALAATGVGKIIRSFPRIAGIDATGTVISSADARFKAGDEVICTSYEFGVGHDGGYSQVCRVPADWVVPLPKGLTLFDAAALGVAGYTAGLAVELLELNGMAPTNGKVLVNGATGGVATLAIDMLAALGYPVVAVTGKDAEHDFLRKLGAQEVLSRQGLEMGNRPLEKALWAAAFDSVGGEQLAWLTRTMRQDGLIASFGNAGGIELKTTVLPFILRGVRLIGVNSGDTPMPLRREVWGRLATDLRPRHLGDIAHIIKLEDLPAYFDSMLKGQIRGRAVVQLS